jgi:RHS repeat-associated protein
MATVRYTTLNGEIVAEKRAGVRRLYQPDPLGSTVGLLDSTQTQTDTLSYWPYGEERSRTGTTATPFRFVGTRGYHRDSPTRGYVRARCFDTATGRWLSPDPLGMTGGDGNRYRYARANPTTPTDPTGLVPIVILPIGIAILLGCCVAVCAGTAYCFIKYRRTCEIMCRDKKPKPPEYASCMTLCLVKTCCVINIPGAEPVLKVSCGLCATCLGVVPPMLVIGAAAGALNPRTRAAAPDSATRLPPSTIGAPAE